MNPQSKNKILLIIIGVLLITNMVLLSFFIFNKEAPKKSWREERKTMIHSFLQKEIGFNQQQLQQYNVLNEQHRNKIKPMYDAVKIEIQLNKICHQSDWIMLSHYLIAHGRAICKARSPSCSDCFLLNSCPQRFL